MGDTEVSENTKSEHLGMISSVKDENKLNIQKRISLAHRTSLSSLKYLRYKRVSLSIYISYCIIIVIAIF